MKRIPAILLIFLALTVTLASCEYFVPGAGEDRRSPLLPTGEGETSPSDPAQEDDSVDEYGFTLFPEGSYLADPMFDTEEYLEDFDANPSCIQFLSAVNSLCGTDTTIFSCPNVPGGTMKKIFFTDKKTGISMPLCGKPECLHNDESCNAYVQNLIGLSVYDGKLYWCDRGKSTIYRMNLDGTDREEVCSISGDNVNGGSNPCAAFHRGYFYYGVIKKAAVNGRPMNRSYIVAQPLDGGESFVLLDRYLEGSSDCLIKPIGKDLYIFINAFTRDDNGAMTKTLLELYRWDSETRKAQQIFTVRDDTGSEEYSCRSYGLVPGDGVYYSIVDGADGTTVRKYSFDTKTTETVLHFNEADGFDDIYFTREYIVAPMGFPMEDGSRGHRTLLYDYSGELKAELDTGVYSYTVFIGEDRGYLYGEYLHVPMPPPEDLIGLYFAVPLDGGEILVIDQ